MPSRRARISLISHFMLTVIACVFMLPQIATAQAPSKEEFEKALATELPEDPAKVIAVVGESKILLGDVKAKVDARINSVIDKAQQDVPEEQIKYARVNLTRGFLRQSIENKMMRESFLLGQVGTQAADKRAEASQMMSSRARQMFIEAEIPELLKKYGVDDRAALDDVLRKEGSSLTARQREFTDAMLGHLYIRSSVDKDPPVSLAEIIQYYNANRQQYEHKSQARWEQLTVMFSKFPSRAAADAVIRDMGREAYFGGSMQSVARQKSQEPLASSGGVHDWTNQGSLASDAIDHMIFSMPLDKMSDIIEDDQGFHIIRVLERRPAGVKPLKDLQSDIRKQIQRQKVLKSQKKMMEDMKKRVPVWTMFPEDIPGSKPLPGMQRASGDATLR